MKKRGIPAPGAWSGNKAGTRTWLCDTKLSEGWRLLAEIIDGKALAARIREDLRARSDAYRRRTGRAPGLGVILAGDDPASAVYVRNKQRACDKAGIYSEVVQMPEECTEKELLAIVERMNHDKRLDGVLVQLPLPAGLDAQKITGAVSPEKDVDGLHPHNAGLLMGGGTPLTACTPRAVLELIRSTGTELCGKHAVIVGRSSLVGKPLALLLLKEDATVTICHSKTENLDEITSRADVLISAAGHPGLITAEHVKPGAVVIDVGTTRIDGKVTGDVLFDEVSEKAGYITPVPGGVGPVTVTMLLANTLEACEA